MDREKKILAKRALVLVTIVPICLLWDGFYVCMKHLMKAWDWVDAKGDIISDDINRWSLRG